MHAKHFQTLTRQREIYKIKKCRNKRGGESAQCGKIIQVLAIEEGS